MKKTRLFLTVILILQSLYFLSCKQDGMGGVGRCETRIGQNNDGVTPGTLIGCAEYTTNAACDNYKSEVIQNARRQGASYAEMDKYFKINFRANSSCSKTNLLASCRTIYSNATAYLYKVSTRDSENDKAIDEFFKGCPSGSIKKIH